MKSIVTVCLVALALTCVTVAQNSKETAIRHGVHVEMAVASHAVATPAADEKDATVVAVAADGKVFIDAKAVEVAALSNTGTGTVYVKADARVPYQKILDVLDALHGRAVVLLTAPTVKVEKQGIVPPYGMKVTVGEL
ncbi:MAG TPA: biopolymer transporter ExbD [candidate division Zixibacteria bacterium]|nr:biopolymer transporter ExbD [candidate division Zixibacteria bacterium]